MLMRSSTSLFALVALLALVAAQEPEGKVGELDGKWTGVRLEWGGEVSEEAGKRIKLEIAKGKLVAVNEGLMEGTIQIDSAQTPKHIEWKAATKTGPNSGTWVITGIYELNGDTLQICYNKDLPRPTAFSTKGQGRGGYLLTLQRSK